MTNQPNQTVTIRFVVDAQAAIAGAKNFRAEVETLKEKMKAAAAESGSKFKDLAVAMQAAAKISYQKQIDNVKEFGVEGQKTGDIVTNRFREIAAAATQTTKAISTATTELNKGAGKASGGFTVLGGAIASALGFGAAQMIGRLIGLFRDFIGLLVTSTQYAYELAKGMYQLNVGVNALRRAGVDITFKQVDDQLNKLKTDFGIFSKKELVEGASAFLNLNRDMGFTAEQLFELQENIATLAIVNGRAMDEVQKTVALALSSGYTEGLQRLGVSINRVTIAEEAQRLGFAKSYMALNEKQRALATYNLILEKTSVYSADLLNYQKTLPGRIDETRAAIVDASAKTGESLLGVSLAWEKLKLNVINSIGIMATFIKGLNEAEKRYADEEEEILGRRLTAWEKFIVKIKSSQDWAANVINFFENGIPLPTSEPENVPEVTPQTDEGLTQDQVDIVDSAGQKILDLQRQYDIDRRDLAIDLQNDLARIERDGQQKLEDLASSHAQKMLDIANKASDEIRDANLRYALDVQQAWDEYYSNVAAAAEKHANKLLSIEENYQEKLQKLREGFLFDLEDAVRLRDARSILQLIKRYNIERHQADRERDQNIREENRAYAEQLHELDRQRNIRLKKLQQELALRLQMIATARDRELALEQEAYTHKKLEQEAENKQDIEDRNLKYQQDLAALALHFDDRLKEIALGLANELKVTAEGMNAVLGVLQSAIGPGGAATRLFDYYVAYAQAAMAAAMAATAMLPTIGPPAPIHGRAKGGIDIANTPTNLTFGEAGPEMHMFIPLSKNLADLGASVGGTPTNGGNGNKSSKIKLEVLLDPRLEGRIVDATLDSVADIIIRRVGR